jgi:lysine 6-dehydrogenase
VTQTLILGAGTVGRAAAWDLDRRGHEVTVADSSEEAASTLGDEIGAAWSQIDVTNVDAVAAALGRADCVISAVPYVFGEQLARAAIEHRCHYFDFGGNPAIVQRQLLLDAAAREAGVAVVPDCGLAPGFANVVAAGMIAHAPADRLDVQIRVGVLPQQPVGALRYQLAFYAGGLINEYAEPCEVIADGMATAVAPLGRVESVDWPGLGTLEAFSTAGGTSTMCRDYEGRIESLEYKTLRYPGHVAVFAALRELGFFSTVPRSGIVPRELLIDLLSERLPAGEPDVTLARIVVTAPGYRHDRRLEDRSDDRFSSLARTTAFPTTALCDLIATGAVGFRGADAMHAVADPDDLEHQLAPLGIVATND